MNFFHISNCTNTIKNNKERKSRSNQIKLKITRNDEFVPRGIFKYSFQKSNRN